MKRDTFGGPQAEPDDDITAIFNEEFGEDAGQELEAEADTFEETPHLDGWNTSVRDTEGNEVVARGFATQAELEAYLAKHGVAVIK